MQIEKGGMFQERCGRTYLFMFNTPIKYIYIERMKTKMPWWNKPGPPQLCMLPDVWKNRCVLIGGLDRGPIYQSKIHTHKAAVSFTTLAGKSCVHILYLLVLCKYLLISSSLESKHPKSTFLSYKWWDRCMLIFLILYLFLLGSQTMFISNQGSHFKAGPGGGNRELTDDGGQRGCLAWELKGTKWSQLLVWEGWGQHAKQGSSPPARLCFEGLSDFLLFNMKL